MTPIRITLSGMALAAAMVLAAIFASQGGVPMGTIRCADCMVTGGTVNVWRDRQRSAVVCRVPVGADVAIISEVDGHYRVRWSDRCIGYVSVAMVARQ